MKCLVCGCWVEIEEPNPTDVGYFMCDECFDAVEAREADLMYPKVET
jgi:hypothetical protein